MVTAAGWASATFAAGAADIVCFTVVATTGFAAGAAEDFTMPNRFASCRATPLFAAAVSVLDCCLGAVTPGLPSPIFDMMCPPWV
ncbi:hypothetical protein D7X12_07540 [Corallococcus sicarius]|uniref:Uncharacterized protein n=1 Tax=Corallococcus sicarius TaxID=2316726 RepID=A0A3A8P1K5_9BACT|nr:hypothetical protein D7X12_07540 [Corallococcus sicarius]